MAGVQGPQGPKGDTGPAGPPGEKGDPGEFDESKIRDRIQNVDGDNPTTRVLCDSQCIALTHNGVTYQLALNDGTDGDIMISTTTVTQPPENSPPGTQPIVTRSMRWSKSNRISKSMVDNQWNSILQSLVECQIDKIVLQVGDQAYNLMIGDSASDGKSLIVKNGHDLVLGDVFRIRKSVTNQSTGVITDKSSIECLSDGLELKTGTVSITLKLDGGSNGQPLIKQGNELIFGWLTKIGYSSIVNNVLTENSSIVCTEEGIKLKIGSSEYLMTLTGGQDDSPLVKSGNSLVWGDPITITQGNIVLVNALPDVTTAALDSIYFVYDLTQPITEYPPTTPPSTNP